MKCSEAIKRLQRIIDACGDLPIVGGCMNDDDTPLANIIVIDEGGVEVGWIGERSGEATGVFLEW